MHSYALLTDRMLHHFFRNLKQNLNCFKFRKKLCNMLSKFVPLFSADTLRSIIYYHTLWFTLEQNEVILCYQTEFDLKTFFLLQLLFATPYTFNPFFKLVVKQQTRTKILNYYKKKFVITNGM